MEEVCVSSVKINETFCGNSVHAAQNSHIPWKGRYIMLIGIVLLVIYHFVKQRRIRMSILQRNGIPGPKPSWIWGNLQEYLATPNVIWDSELIKKYGPICGYYLGAKPVILVSDPTLIDLIQSKRGGDFLDRPRRVPGGINPDPKRQKMLGNVKVAEWKTLRGILDKGFSPSRRRAMSEEANKLIQKFMLHVTPFSDNTNFYHLYQNLTLDLIGKTGFGHDSNIQDNPNDSLKAAVEQEFSKSTNSFILKLFLCFPEVHCFLQPIRVWWEKLMNYWGLGGHSELWKLGEQVVEQRSRTSEVASDLLHVMLESGKLTTDQIVANSVLLFEAGFETMSAGLGFITYLLIKDEDVQNNVRKEIKDIFHATGGEVTCLETLKKLRYLDVVIQESLRMFPPQTTFIGRSGVKDIQHQFSWNDTPKQCNIPANVHIQIGLYQILNSNQIWESPRAFNPERFLKEQLSPEQTIVNQPFGKGRRMCIGRKYADDTMKLLLVQLLSKFKLVPSNKTEEEISVIYKTATMTPKHGVFGKVILDPLF